MPSQYNYFDFEWRNQEESYGGDSEGNYRVSEYSRLSGMFVKIFDDLKEEFYEFVSSNI